MNIKAEADSLETERLEGMNLQSTMNVINSNISSIQWDIIRGLDKKTISTDEIKDQLKDYWYFIKLDVFFIEYS